MRRLVIAAAIAMGMGIAATAAPAAAQAHRHHPHGKWHHARYVGPSYYPIYRFFDREPYAPVCVWHRDWDAYWHRDCF